MIQRTERRYSFFVEGTPEAQGSMRAFVRGKHAVVTHNSKAVIPWRNAVAHAAREAGWDGRWLLDGAVHVSAHFLYRRPASHYRKDGTLKSSAPKMPHRTGKDTDKLQRAIGDALNGVVWTDDRRIVGWDARRLWTSEREGVKVHVERVSDEVLELKEEA